MKHIQIPIWKATIQGGKLKLRNPKEFTAYMAGLEGKEVNLVVEKFKFKRTRKQNNSIHLYCQQLADTLNDAGLDQRKVLKPEVDIPWDMEDVKEKIWRPIQIALTKKESTTELARDKEIEEISIIINRHLTEKFPGFPYIPFPFQCKSCGGLSKHFEGCPEI